jgi:hypothetical protein
MAAMIRDSSRMEFLRITGFEFSIEEIEEFLTAPKPEIARAAYRGRFGQRRTVAFDSK